VSGESTEERSDKRWPLEMMWQREKVNVTVKAWDIAITTSRAGENIYYELCDRTPTNKWSNLK
jgi:hypothetical protein